MENGKELTKIHGWLLPIQWVADRVRIIPGCIHDSPYARVYPPDNMVAFAAARQRDLEEFVDRRWK